MASPPRMGETEGFIPPRGHPQNAPSAWESEALGKRSPFLVRIKGTVVFQKVIRNKLHIPRLVLVPKACAHINPVSPPGPLSVGDKRPSHGSFQWQENTGQACNDLHGSIWLREPQSATSGHQRGVCQGQIFRCSTFTG